MTVGELRRRLRAAGVRDTAYGVLRERDEAYCLLRDDEGWLVFYSERGGRNDERRHADEDAACRDVLARIERDRSTGWAPPPFEGA